MPLSRGSVSVTHPPPNAVQDETFEHFVAPMPYLAKGVPRLFTVHTPEEQKQAATVLCR